VNAGGMNQPWPCRLTFPKTNVQARYDTKIVELYFPELLKIGGEQRGTKGLYSGLGPTLLSFQVKWSSTKYYMDLIIRGQLHSTKLLCCHRS
jgi:hypothetical protein